MAIAILGISAVAVTSNGANALWVGATNAIDNNAGTAASINGLTGPSDFLDLTLTGMPSAVAATAITSLSLTFTGISVGTP